MKYLEQRVEELEKEVNLLKAKIKLNDTSSYLNNYPPYNDRDKKDYMYDHSNKTLLSESGLGTYVSHFWDSSELEKNPLDTITTKLSSIFEDTPDGCNYIDASDMPYYHPEYPYILGSWDDSIKTEDIINKTNKPNLEKRIEDKFGKIICKFPVWHHEWEMDGYGYIVESNCSKNIRNLILTDHGMPYKSDIETLNKRLSIYKDVIQQTERAMFLLK